MISICTTLAWRRSLFSFKCDSSSIVIDCFVEICCNIQTPMAVFFLFFAAGFRFVLLSIFYRLLYLFYAVVFVTIHRNAEIKAIIFLNFFSRRWFHFLFFSKLNFLGISKHIFCLLISFINRLDQSFGKNCIVMIDFPSQIFRSHKTLFISFSFA